MLIYACESSYAYSSQSSLILNFFNADSNVNNVQSYNINNNIFHGFSLFPAI